MRHAANVFDLAHAGRVALAAGLDAWSRGIQDPTRKAFDDPAFDEDRRFIDEIIRTDKGLGWGRCSALTKAYRWDGDFEWCGAFAAFCWSASIPLAIRKRYFSSTYRLDRYGRHKRAFAEVLPPLPLPALRRKHLVIGGETGPINDFGPRAGDILVVNGSTFGWGQHICIVERWDNFNCVFHTVEGNATGRGPDGQRFQGVVRQVRGLVSCRRLIRPGICDLEVRA